MRPDCWVNSAVYEGFEGGDDIRTEGEVGREKRLVLFSSLRSTTHSTHKHEANEHRTQNLLVVFGLFIIICM